MKNDNVVILRRMLGMPAKPDDGSQAGNPNVIDVIIAHPESGQTAASVIPVQEFRAVQDRCEQFRGALRQAKGEFETLRNWMDRASASDYRYRDDPALSGHREAANESAKTIARILGEPPSAQETKG